MASFRFIHAADLHLDTPFEGLGRTSPELGAALRDASLEAFDALVDLTLREQAAFLVVAGDVYDGAERGVRAQLRFRAGVERLAAAGVQVLVTHGNHDPLDGWSAVRSWPEGVHVFGSEAVESVPVQRDGRVLATVHGISYATRDPGESLVPRFAGVTGSGVQVAVLHCNAGADPAHAAYSPCTVEELCAIGVDYWALGHVHRFAVLSRPAPWVVYAGGLQGRSPRVGELGAKGAVVVEVEGGTVREVRFAPLDRVRFATLDVDAAACEDLPALRAALAEAAAEARAEAPGRGLVLRGVLAGRSPLHADLVRTGALGALLEDLRADAAEQRPFVWWNELRDRTQPLLDRDAVLARDDFQSALLALADAANADAALLAELDAAAGAGLPEARLRRWLVDGEAADAGALARAELRALDLLEQEPAR